MANPIRQLLSQTSYVADGVNTVWNFSFSGGYLDVSHVKARYVDADAAINNITIVPSMLVGPYQLSIVPPVPAGCELTIYRDTDKDGPLVNFADGAQFTEASLDLNAKQAVFVSAEAFDSVNTAVESVAQVASQVAIATNKAAAAAASSEAAEAASAYVVGVAGTLASTVSAAEAATTAASAAAAGANALGAMLSGGAGSGQLGFTPLGVGAVATTVQAVLRELPSLTNFYSPSDGANYTNAMRKALAHSALVGTRIYVPAGTFNLPGWTTYDASFAALVGDSRETTRIVGPTQAGVHFLKMVGGVCDVEGISFEGFDNVIYSEAAYSLLRIHRCKGYRNRNFLARQADVSDYPASKINRALLTENYIEKSGGFMLHGACDSAIADANQGVNVGRDASVWSGDMVQTFFISIGDTDNNNSSIAQALVSGVVMTSNTLDGMSNSTPGGQFNTTNGLQVSAISALIDGNVIKNMSSTDGTNCEAIYCKLQNGVISNNVTVDGTTKSASIAIKGGAGPYMPTGFNLVVTGNNCSALNQECESGIVIFGGASTEVIGNTVSGMEKDSIKSYLYTNRVHIVANTVRGNKGTRSISVQASQVSNVLIAHNKIDTLSSPSGDVTPIHVNAAKGQIYSYNVESGGSGYVQASTTVTVTGDGTTATAQATVVGGVVVGVGLINPGINYTTATVTINGVGTGAVASANIGNGSINDLSVKGNHIAVTPNSGWSSFTGIYVSSSGTVNGGSSGIVAKDNTIAIDASTVPSYNFAGVNIFAPTAGHFGSIEIDGLKMYGQADAKLVPMLMNSSTALHTASAYYGSLDVRNIVVNGRGRRVLSAAQSNDTSATFVVNLSEFGAVGGNIIGYIPNSVIVKKALLFTSTAPTSGTSTATLALSLGSAASYGLLSPTLVTAFSANAFKDGVPTGTAATAKRTFAVSGRVPVYLDVTVEALTGGILTIMLDTEAIA